MCPWAHTTQMQNFVVLLRRIECHDSLNATDSQSIDYLMNGEPGEYKTPDSSTKLRILIVLSHEVLQTS